MISKEDYLKPISSDSPIGSDARYENVYESLEDEIKKFGSLFDETVNWEVVFTLSTTVLTEYSKDLKALCYFVRSAQHQEGIEGLITALQVLEQSIDTFKNELYPQRKRAQIGALNWLAQHLELLFKENNKLTIESIDQIIALLINVDDLASTHFGEETDLFSVVSLLRDSKKRLELEVIDVPEPEPAPPTPKANKTTSESEGKVETKAKTAPSATPKEKAKTT